MRPPPRTEDFTGAVARDFLAAGRVPDATPSWRVLTVDRIEASAPEAAGVTC